MRLTYYVIAVLLCFGTKGFATSLVNINVVNPTVRQFRISYVQDAVTAKQRIFRIQLRDDNSASFELSLPRRTELTMTYDDLDIPLYIGPDDQLSIQFDGAAGLETIQFGGPVAAENQFMAAYAKTFPTSSMQEQGGGFLPFTVERQVLAEAAAADAESFAKYVYAEYDAKINLINGYQGDVNSALLERYRTKALYDGEIKKLGFLVFNQQMLDELGLRNAIAHLNVKPVNGVTDQRLLQYDEFKTYLIAYAQHLVLPNNGGHDERNGDRLFTAIGAQINRPWRHYLQSELLINAFDYLNNPEFGLDRYTAMKRDGASQVYRQRVESAYGEVLNLSPNAIAPNIGMYYVDGRPKSLTDFSGKVVYISFWASWCKPCIVNFKKYDGIRRQLQEKGIVLLNVSIDDDEFDWKRAVEKEYPRGENVRATNLDDVKRNYNLASIPAYYIIDKHGKIAVLPEGDNRDLVASFDEILLR